MQKTEGNKNLALFAQKVQKVKGKVCPIRESHYAALISDFSARSRNCGKRDMGPVRGVPVYLT